MKTPTLRLALAAIALPCAALAQQPAAALRPGMPDTSPFRQLELPTPNGVRSVSGMPGPSYWQQKVSYNITASLDTATHTIHGQETITYRNNSPDTLRYLWLQVDRNQNAAQTRFKILSPAPADSGVTIEHIDALYAARPGARAATTSLTWRVNSTMMRVDLDRPLPPHSEAQVAIGWHHTVPQRGRTGRERQPHGDWLYQVAEWFPRLAVYDDVRGWNTDQYLGSGEFYLEYGDFDVAITMPAGFTVTATGVLRNPAEVLPALLRDRLFAAAHSDSIVRVIAPGETGTATILPANVGATRTWRYHAGNVHDFAWATSANYLWDASSWDGILMQALYPPEKSAAWNTAADMTRHAVMYHSRWFHYPWPTAVSAQGPVGGMEYPMMTFDNDDNVKELYYTIAHEQGHEWYPMIVGSNERLYPWMDEGFNTFIDWFSFRDRYPTDTTRIQSLEFGAMSAWQRFLEQRAPETPIMEPQDRAASGLMAGWNAYGKPAVGLHFLREQVVDSNAFDAAFAEYTRRWAFRHPTPADFFRSMNDGLGEDLSWFWRSWFIRSDHLDQAVDSVVVAENNGQAASRVFLSNRREMVAPVELRITLTDGSTRIAKLPVETWFRGATFVWRLATPARPVRVEIDPRRVYPDTDRSNNTWVAP